MSGWMDGNIIGMRNCVHVCVRERERERWGNHAWWGGEDPTDDQHTTPVAIKHEPPAVVVEIISLLERPVEFVVAEGRHGSGTIRREIVHLVKGQEEKNKTMGRKQCKANTRAAI